VHFQTVSLQFVIGWLALLVIVYLLFKLVKTIRNHMRRTESDGNGIITAVRSQIFKRERGYRCSYSAANEYIEDLKGDKNKVVAVFDVKGPIMSDRQSVPPLARNFATFGSELGSILRKLAKNKRVAAVLVRFNPPGGTVTGSEDICNGLDACRKAGKLTVSYVSDISASGGVMAMVGAERIFAHPNAMIGSVGVLGPQITYYEGVTEIGSGLFGESVRADKMTFERLSVGKGKTIGDPFAEPDKDAVRDLKRILDRVYDRFLAHIKHYRGIAEEVMRAKGASVFDAMDALELKLVDQIGDYAAVQRFIAEKVGMAWGECTKIEVVLSGKDRLSGFFVQLFVVAEAFGLASTTRMLSCGFRNDVALLLSSRWFGLP